MAPHQAHAAFPKRLHAAEIPNTAGQLYDLIKSSASDPVVLRHTLIPALDDIEKGVNQTGTTKEQKRESGEQVLQLRDVDLSTWSDGEVAQLASGLIYIVSARLHSKQFDTAASLDLAMRLCLIAGQDHIALSRHRVGALAWDMLRLAKSFKQTRRIVEPLYAVVSRINRGVLSGAHGALLEACLQEKMYDYGFPFIGELYLDVKSAAPSYLDVLAYYHHAGLIASVYGLWEEARNLFLVAVTLPTSAVSEIQVACAKRAILSELLVSGKLLHFPKYTSGVVNRVIEREGAKYLQFAKAFEGQDWPAVYKAAEGERIFADDCNVGMLRQIIRSILRRKILKQRETYERISLADLAWKVNAGGADTGEVLAVLHYMVQSGEIQASITDGPTQIVTFLPDGPEPDPLRAVESIRHATALASWFEEQLTSAARHMGTSEKWLKKQHDMTIVSGKGKGGGGSKGPGGGVDVFGIPEDMFEASSMGTAGLGSIGRSRVGGDMGDMGF